MAGTIQLTQSAVRRRSRWAWVCLALVAIVLAKSFSGRGPGRLLRDAQKRGAGAEETAADLTLIRW